VNDNGARQSPAATIHINRSDRSVWGAALVSAPLVTAAELAQLVELPPAILRADRGPIPLVAWAHQRDRIADSISRLRRRHPDPLSYDRLLADRIAASLDSLDAMLEPTAADLVGAGFDVDEALGHVDRQRDRLYARMGGTP
jgi:hypothetical protein